MLDILCGLPSGMQAQIVDDCLVFMRHFMLDILCGLLSGMQEQIVDDCLVIMRHFVLEILCGLLSVCRSKLWMTGIYETLCA